MLQTGRRLASVAAGGQGRTLCSVFVAYAEEYLVDVKFVRDPIGTALFDHLVGAGERCRWHTEAQRFGGIEVDEQLDLCRLLDWKVGYVPAFENSGGIDADLTERLGKAAESGQARVRIRIMKVS